MEDMDKARTPFGIVADLSKWDISPGGFNHMKLSSTEKVIEPEEDTTKKVSETIEPEKSPPESEETKEEKIEIPNNQRYVNPIELKNIAIRLMPSADKINPENYDNVCEKAIDLAYNFLKVWDLKVEIAK